MLINSIAFPYEAIDASRLQAGCFVPGWLAGATPLHRGVASVVGLARLGLHLHILRESCHLATFAGHWIVGAGMGGRSFRPPPAWRQTIIANARAALGLFLWNQLGP